jgi:GNAT superfamily N-acetyltransferase
VEAGLDVRPAVPGDAAALARCHVACWRETYAGLLSERLLDGLAVAEFQDRWERRLVPADPCVVLVAVRGPEVVGFAAGGPSRDEPPVRAVELRALYTRAVHHGQGLGQTLLDAVVADQPCSLWVARDNPRARAFYARNGLRPDGQVKVDAGFEDLVEVRLVR